MAPLSSADHPAKDSHIPTQELGTSKMKTIGFSKNLSVSFACGNPTILLRIALRVW